MALKKIRIIFLFILIVSCFSLLFARNVQFSNYYDIQSLPMQKELFNESGKVAGEKSLQINFSINEADCELLSTSSGFESLRIKGLNTIKDPGKPQLPMASIVRQFPLNTKMLGVKIYSGKYAEIAEAIDIAPAPEAVKWNMYDNKSLENIRAKAIYRRNNLLEKDTKIYSSNNFYPDKLFSYETGKDNDALYLYLKIFPVQYQPASKKLSIITDLVIDVYYVETEESSFEASPEATSDPCIIICPASFNTQATQLETFHETELGTATTIITTDYIDSNFTAAEDPPFPGYKDLSLTGRGNISGYHYTLAKKIISYLRNSAEHPNLEFIVILGDAGIVPPSYYWSDSGGSYDSWVPTDFFYASPDYDLTSNFKIGRICVNNTTEASTYVTKLSNWYPADWNWFKKATILGGQPFGDMYYYGEVMTLDSANQEYFNGMDITKCYLTDNNFTKSIAEPYLQTNDGGFFYDICHGSGIAIYFDDGTNISASNLLGYSANTEVPVVVSIACDDGFFDSDLYPAPYLSSPYVSFGEGIIRSPAGGIAYFGGSRTNYGAPDITFNNGTMIIGEEPFMAGMLSGLFKSYHSGKTTLGDLGQDAINDFVANNTMTGIDDIAIINRTTLFEFVLLGDPALKIPQQQSGPSYTMAQCSALNPDTYTTSNVPQYTNLPLDLSESVTVRTSNTNSPTIDVKLLYTWTNNWLDRQYDKIITYDYTFNPSLCGYHAFRVVLEDGKETLFYLNTQMQFEKNAPILLVDNDGGSDIDQYYKNAIPSYYPYSYDNWEVGARDEATSSILNLYAQGVVIWFDPYYYPLDAQRTAIMDYLDHYGHLFITGQDIGFYLGPSNPFMNNYLSAQYVQDNVQMWYLNGVAGDPITNGLHLTISGSGGANNQSWPDEIDPIAPAVKIFGYSSSKPSENNGEGIVSSGSGGIRVVENGHKVVYLSFGFEGINSSSDRANLMKKILDWLYPIVASTSDEWMMYR